MRQLKRILAVILSAALMLCGMTTTAKPLFEYNDYNAILQAAQGSSDENAMLEAVQLLSDLNAIGGDGKQLRLEEPFTRAQFAALVYKFATGKTDMTEAEKASYRALSVFSDLDSTPWAVPFINWASMRGYVSGVGNGMFAPNRAITQSEAIILLGKVLGFDSVKSNVPKQKPGEDYADYMTHVAMYVEDLFSIMRGSFAASSSGITRGEAFVFFANALDAQRITYDSIGTIRRGKTFGETSYGLQTINGIITGIYYANINSSGTVLTNPSNAQISLTEARIAGSNVYFVGEALTVSLPADVSGVMDAYSYLGREVTVTVKLASIGSNRVEIQYGAVTKTANNYETIPVYSASERTLTWKNAMGQDAVIHTAGSGLGSETRGSVAVIQNGENVSNGFAINPQASFSFVSRGGSEDGMIIAFAPTAVKVIGSSDGGTEWSLRTLNGTDTFGAEFGVSAAVKNIVLPADAFIEGTEYLSSEPVAAVLPVGGGQFIAFKTEVLRQVKSTAIVTGQSIIAGDLAYYSSELNGSRGKSVSASDTGSIFDIRLYEGKIIDFSLVSSPAGIGVVYASVPNGANSTVSILKKDGTTFTARLNYAGKARQKGAAGIVWTPAEDGQDSPLWGTVPSASGTADIALPLNTTQDAVLVQYSQSEDASTVTISYAASETSTYRYYYETKPDYISIAAYDGGTDKFLTAPDMIPVFEANGSGLSGGVSLFTANGDIGVDTYNARAYILRNSQNIIVGAIATKRTEPAIASATGLYYVLDQTGPVTVDGDDFVVTQSLYSFADGEAVTASYAYMSAAEAVAANAKRPEKGSFIQITSDITEGHRTWLEFSVWQLSEFYSFTVENLSGANFYDADAHRYDFSKTVVSFAVRNKDGNITGLIQGDTSQIKSGAVVYIITDIGSQHQDRFGIPAVLVIEP